MAPPMMEVVAEVVLLELVVAVLVPDVVAQHSQVGVPGPILMPLVPAVGSGCF